MIQRLAVVLSEGAIADLEAIAAYILESGGSETAANGFIDRIRERCQSIGN
ncbi:type II toxin-antitoxin system RelE/ParE family toxin, partial [Mesorhizobium sp. M1D.F.Ca.ET.234.01.1.1]